MCRQIGNLYSPRVETDINNFRNKLQHHFNSCHKSCYCYHCLNDNRTKWQTNTINSFKYFWQKSSLFRLSSRFAYKILIWKHEPTYSLNYIIPCLVQSLRTIKLGTFFIYICFCVTGLAIRNYFSFHDQYCQQSFQHRL